MGAPVMYHSEGRWVTYVEAERTGTISAHGPDPLAALSALVSAVVEDLDARDEELEEVRGVTS